MKFRLDFTFRELGAAQMAKAKSVLYLSEEQVLDLLKQRMGVKMQMEFAAELEVSTSMLSDILKGRRHPGASVLKFLGVERCVMYKLDDGGK